MAKLAVSSGSFDMAAFTDAMIDAVGKSDAASACDLVCNTREDAEVWLPEALMLLGVPGLSILQQRKMIEKVFHQTVADEAQASILVRCSGRIGKYGFSFPQWRYLTQSFEGRTLAEDFGMQRLTRPSDIRDPQVPEPGRDLLGPGFCWQESNWYIEYRRAYIACADGESALIIRNNSPFFGRDRLSAPAYASWDKMDAATLQDITKEALENSDKFISWQECLGADIEKLLKIERLIDFIDAFDARLHRWLVTFEKGGGLPSLAAFLRHKVSSAVYLAETDAHMPPWFPTSAIVVNANVCRMLEAFLGGEVALSPVLEKFFSPKTPGRVRTVLLSGPNGDRPVW